MHKDFASFGEGIRALRSVSFSINTLLDGVSDDEWEVMRRLAAAAAWYDHEGRSPQLVIRGWEVRYTTSGGLVFGWDSPDEDSDRPWRFYLRRPTERLYIRPLSQSELIPAALAAGFILEAEEEAAWKAAHEADKEAGGAAHGVMAAKLIERLRRAGDRRRESPGG